MPRIAVLRLPSLRVQPLAQVGFGAVTKIHPRSWSGRSGDREHADPPGLGIYLAPEPSPHRALRVDVARKDRPTDRSGESLPRQRIFVQGVAGPPATGSRLLSIASLRALVTARRAREVVLLGERARRWGGPPGLTGGDGTAIAVAAAREGLRSSERPGEPAPMRAGPRRNPSRGSRAALAHALTPAIAILTTAGPRGREDRSCEHALA